MDMEKKIPHLQHEPKKTICLEGIAFHEDAGHGWLEVPFSLLVVLGIEDQITGYSYRYLDKAYLEEDLDLSTFVRALFAYLEIPRDAKRFWSDFVSKQTVCDWSPIRSFPRYAV